MPVKLDLAYALMSQQKMSFVFTFPLAHSSSHIGAQFVATYILY
ncbi:hypothetical protein JCM19236_2113 [Vibrio sp. JCM 19236]|nr:hypothetical protein JCM19236_2113 [Vibrio sp. JCM 19236]